MRLFYFVKDECIVPGCKLIDKSTALRKIAQTAKKNILLKNITVDTILQALQEREELGSTGFGNGIAIPHCRLSDIDDFVIGIITIPEGVDFDALDKKKVQLIVFIIAPKRDSNEHIRILSEISHILRMAGAVKELLQETHAETIKESFLRYEKDEVKTNDHSGKTLFHIIIQNEDRFKEILQAITAMESVSITVIEAMNAGEHLTKLSLFSDFWGDNSVKTCRIIIAVAEKKLTNEIIRRIEHITGHLDNSSDIMVTVQDVLYAAGALDI